MECIAIQCNFVTLMPCLGVYFKVIFLFFELH